MKNLPIALKSSPSEQLNTTHCLAIALAKSFVVSVFPVPAGPSGAPPRYNFNAPISVLFNSKTFKNEIKILIKIVILPVTSIC